MSSRLRRPLRALAMLLLVVFVATACSSAGTPISFEDQPDDSGVSLVKRNWDEGCQVAFTEDLAGDANAICECSYNKITTLLTFEQFIALNDRLKDDPSALAESAKVVDSDDFKAVQAVSDCIAEA